MAFQSRDHVFRCKVFHCKQFGLGKAKAPTGRKPTMEMLVVTPILAAIQYSLLYLLLGGGLGGAILIYIVAKMLGQ
jgi:hypothetical protein